MLPSTHDIPYTATVTATFTAIDDGEGEEAETFTVSLSEKVETLEENNDTTTPELNASSGFVLPRDLRLTIPQHGLTEYIIHSPYPDGTALTERDGPVQFEITRDRASTSTQPLRIRVWETGYLIDGYKSSIRTINMSPDTTTRRIYVQIEDDRRYEAHSTIMARIFDDDGFMVSPTHGSARLVVQDDDFPRGVALRVSADRTTLREGESVTLTFTFRTRDHELPHADGGTFGIDVSGDSADYLLSTTTISAPQSAFRQAGGHARYIATSTATFSTLRTIRPRPLRRSPSACPGERARSGASPCQTTWY